MNEGIEAMTADHQPETVPPVDLPLALAFTDEAGAKAYLRNLTEEDDPKIAVFVSVIIPAKHQAPFRALLQPGFDRFAGVKPPDAKLHISEAMAPEHREWGAVASEVRKEFFEICHACRPHIAVSRVRARWIRERRPAEIALLRAPEIQNKGMPVQFPKWRDDERLEGLAFQQLLLDLNAVGVHQQHRVAPILDHLDAALLDHYQELLLRYRHSSDRTVEATGFDTETGTRIPREVRQIVQATGVDGSSIPLNLHHVADPSLAGEVTPELLLADMVANSAYRHLASLPADQNLELTSALDNWELRDWLLH